MIRNKLLETYSPLYLLSALGSGGIAVSFFVYLTFLVDHPGHPMVTFDHLWPIVVGGHPLAGALVGTAALGIAFFGILHLRLLVWNLMELRRFRRTAAYVDLVNSNNEASLMTLPLTLAMTINVLFVAGAVFIPNLWSVVEYLFPFAIVAFAAVGILALRLYARYFTRVISSGDFDLDDNNNLGQMVSVFAFAMIAVGLDMLLLCWAPSYVLLYTSVRSAVSCEFVAAWGRDPGPDARLRRQRPAGFARAAARRVSRVEPSTPDRQTVPGRCAASPHRSVSASAGHGLTGKGNWHPPAAGLARQSRWRLPIPLRRSAGGSVPAEIVSFVVFPGQLAFSFYDQELWGQSQVPE